MNRNHIGSQGGAMVFDKRWFIPSTGERKRQGLVFYKHKILLTGHVCIAEGKLFTPLAPPSESPPRCYGVLPVHTSCASIVEHRTLIMAPFSETIKKATLTGSLFHCLAEREGFEPSERSRVHLISSQAHSASLAPLQNKAHRIRGIDFALNTYRATHSVI